MRARPSAFGMPVFRTAGGKQNALKEGAFGYNLPNKNSVIFGKISLSKKVSPSYGSHIKKSLPLKGRRHDEVVTEGVTLSAVSAR